MEMKCKKCKRFIKKHLIYCKRCLISIFNQEYNDNVMAIEMKIIEGLLFSNYNKDNKKKEAVK